MIKLAGLRIPISFDPVAAKSHILQPKDKVFTDSFQRMLNAKRYEQVYSASQLRLKRPFPKLPLRLDVEGFLSDLASQLNDAEGFVAHIQYPDPLNPDVHLQDSRTGGWAIDPSDTGSLAWKIDRPMHVASVSKFVTAVAMTRELRDYEISPDTPIGGYLPAFWEQGPNIGKVTFRQLLTHTSGIDNSAMDYQSMKMRVYMGVDANKMGQYAYANMNFSLCRILLASILMLEVIFEVESTRTVERGGTKHTPDEGAFPNPLKPAIMKRIVRFVDQ